MRLKFYKQSVIKFTGYSYPIAIVTITKFIYISINERNSLIYKMNYYLIMIYFCVLK